MRFGGFSSVVVVVVLRDWDVLWEEVESGGVW